MAPSTALPTSFVRAFFTPVRGLLFLVHHRSLWKTLAQPLLINAVLFLALLVGYFVSLDDALVLVRGFLGQGAAASPPEALLEWPAYLALQGLGLITPVLSAVLLFLLFGAFFLMGSKLIAAPFFDALSEQVESLHRGERLAEEPFALSRALGDAARAVRQQAIRIALYLLVVGPLFALQLLPGIGTALYVVLAGSYTAWWLGMDLMDPPMGRRRVGLLRKVRFGRRNLPVVLSFGAGSLLLASFPVVNILSSPALIAGGTLLWLDLGGVAFHGEAALMEQP